MAFDGVVIANIVYDMNRLLTGGRIYKIYQPEADELLLVVKNNKETYRLLISAGASLPLIYFTTKTKANPMTAPNFCMLLRKYISNGRIIEITQPGMERIVEITIEHLNELGDTCRKKMVIEIMGKHSNIIFIDEKNMIIDSIKHILLMLYLLNGWKIHCLSNQFLCKKQSMAVFPVSVLCLPMKSATAPTSMEILLLLLLPQCSKVPFTVNSSV